MTTSTEFVNNFKQYHVFFKNMKSNSPVNEHRDLKSQTVTAINIRKKKNTLQMKWKTFIYYNKDNERKVELIVRV